MKLNRALMWYNAWKIRVNGGAISKDIFFSRCEGMWFGSVALYTSSVAKSCVTPSQLIPIGDMCLEGRPLHRCRWYHNILCRYWWKVFIKNVCFPSSIIMYLLLSLSGAALQWSFLWFLIKVHNFYWHDHYSSLKLTHVCVSLIILFLNLFSIFLPVKWRLWWSCKVVHKLFFTG